MPRRRNLSSPIVYRSSHLSRYRGGMTLNDIQVLTGWSRATVCRRVAEPGFPSILKRTRGRPVWDTVEVLEWVSRHNLMVLMGRDGAVQFERKLADQSFADPALQSAIGRAIEREKVRRERVEALRIRQDLT